jgi:hypothetical protein
MTIKISKKQHKNIGLCLAASLLLVCDYGTLAADPEVYLHGKELYKPGAFTPQTAKVERENSKSDPGFFKRKWDTFRNSSYFRSNILDTYPQVVFGIHTDSGESATGRKLNEGRLYSGEYSIEEVRLDFEEVTARISKMAIGDFNIDDQIKKLDQAMKKLSVEVEVAKRFEQKIIESAFYQNFRADRIINFEKNSISPDWEADYLQNTDLILIDTDCSEVGVFVDIWKMRVDNELVNELENAKQMANDLSAASQGARAQVQSKLVDIEKHIYSFGSDIVPRDIRVKRHELLVLEERLKGKANFFNMTAVIIKSMKERIESKEIYGTDDEEYAVLTQVDKLKNAQQICNEEKSFLNLSDAAQYTYLPADAENLSLEMRAKAKELTIHERALAEAEKKEQGRRRSSMQEINRNLGPLRFTP